MDRNDKFHVAVHCVALVALRKESVDRNNPLETLKILAEESLSARRAWIEIISALASYSIIVKSLSARRAWIEIAPEENPTQKRKGRSPQGERG